MKKLFFFILMIFSSSVLLPAQSIDSKQVEKRRIEDEIDYIDRQLRSTTEKQKKSTHSLILTQKKIETRKSLIDRLDNDIRGYEKDIGSKNEDIVRLERRLDTLELRYQRLVYTAYKNRDSKLWFMYIMSSRSMSQGYRRWEYLKQIKTTISKQADEIRDSKEKLDRDRKELIGMKQSSSRTLSRREREYKVLKGEEKGLNITIQKLRNEEKRFRKEIAQKRNEAERLNREIEKLLAAAAKDSSAPPTKFAENKGILSWPVGNGVLAEKFGQSYHPVFKNIKLPFNNGINISTRPDTPVKTIFDGVVKQVIMVPGYNQCILVSHGEYFTFYCKLKKVDVKKGDQVKKGDPIGIVDDSEEGNSILHFEIWKGTVKQNPEHWLKKGIGY